MEIKCRSFMSTIRSVNIGSMFFMLLLAVLEEEKEVKKPALSMSHSFVDLFYRGSHW